MKFAPIIAKDGTGLDLLREIRQKDLTTPFLLMSGGDDKRLEKEAKQYSGGFCCTIFLTKRGDTLIKVTLTNEILRRIAEIDENRFFSVR